MPKFLPCTSGHPCCCCRPLQAAAGAWAVCPPELHASRCGHSQCHHRPPQNPLLHPYDPLTVPSFACAPSPSLTRPFLSVIITAPNFGPSLAKGERQLAVWNPPVAHSIPRSPSLITWGNRAVSLPDLRLPLTTLRRSQSQSSIYSSASPAPKRPLPFSSQPSAEGTETPLSHNQPAASQSHISLTSTWLRTASRRATSRTTSCLRWPPKWHTEVWLLKTSVLLQVLTPPQSAVSTPSSSRKPL